MKRLMLLILLLASSLFMGCNAGTSADLLAYDNITAAADSVIASVDAYNKASKFSTERLQAEFIKSMQKDAYDIALSNDETAESAKILADKIAANLSVAISNFAKENETREKLYSVTMDNLLYIKEVSQQGKDFSIYRSNVSEQWKSYMNAQKRTELESVAK